MFDDIIVKTKHEKKEYNKQKIIDDISEILNYFVLEEKDVVTLINMKSDIECYLKDNDFKYDLKILLNGEVSITIDNYITIKYEDFKKWTKLTWQEN